jgi:DNA-binding NarL/FixJ family response regulator
LVLSAPVVVHEPLEGLTPAQREVAQHILDGKSNREIARARGSAERTVANIASSIYRKLGVHGRAELARRLRAPASRG